MPAPYSSAFYEELDRTGTEAASPVIDQIRRFVRPRRVVDVGCGAGTWLAAFAGRGAEAILGLDLGTVEGSVLKIPADRFRPTDLTRPFEVGETFDLALSLEVGEHLPASSAPGFVASIARLAPVAVFSAAIPGQCGTHHVNEQWPDYWAALFRDNGFLAVDCIRPGIWSDRRIPDYYRQNLLLYVREDRLSDYPEIEAEHRNRAADGRLAMVHPEFFAAKTNPKNLSLRSWLQAIPRMPGKLAGSLAARIRP